MAPTDETRSKQMYIEEQETGRGEELNIHSDNADVLITLGC